LAGVFKKCVLGSRLVDENSPLPLGALVGRGSGWHGAFRYSGINIFDTQAEVVQARPVFVDPFVEGVPLYHGLHELEMGVSKVEMSQFDGALVNDFRTNDGKSELVSPKFECFFGIGNGYGNVIESLVVHVGF